MQRGAQIARRLLGGTSATVGSKTSKNSLKIMVWRILGGLLGGTQLDPKNTKSVPMQRGARFVFCRSVLMQRGARFLILGLPSDGPTWTQ